MAHRDALPGGHAHSKTPEWEDGSPQIYVSPDQHEAMEADTERQLATWQAACAALAIALIAIVVSAVVADTRDLINPPCGRLPLPSYSGQAR